MGKSAFKQIKFLLILWILGLFYTNCGANLHNAYLPTALVDESYYFLLSAENEDWDLYDNTEFVFALTGGTLPGGISVTSYGEIIGTPSVVGTFDFRVTVYAIDHYDFFDGFFYDPYYYDDTVTSDSEWFNLFVTEPSTNPDCPYPDDEITKEFFVCLGNNQINSLTEGDNFDLDLNYFIDFSRSLEYAIESLDITIHYDEALFAVDEDFLNSQNLREAATMAESLVDFDTSQPGQLRIRITSHENLSLHRSGRLLDLTFRTLQDIPAGEHIFPVTINDITSFEDIELPPFIEIDGTLTIDFDV